MRSAGCVFVGWPSATAFGDYVAGSNHILPTGGSARFASALGAAPLPPADGRGARSPTMRCAALVRAGAPIARAEGFGAHAASMRARVADIVENPPA